MGIHIRPLLMGLGSNIPGFYERFGNSGKRAKGKTGGGRSARYCYSIWLRHLITAHQSGTLKPIPRVVAELGPGDSLGVGLAALLSGAQQFKAFDVVAYAQQETNLSILDELVLLFRNRIPVPAGEQYSPLVPTLSDYRFPHHILTEDILNVALDPLRIDKIRQALQKPVGEGGSPMLEYVVPWNGVAQVRAGTVDMVLSQAVMEHVDDVAATEQAIRLWLRPGGIVSHAVDYRCHHLFSTWDGHWGCPDWLWHLLKGKRPFLINRLSHSEQLELLRCAGLEPVHSEMMHKESGLPRSLLNLRYQARPDADHTTMAAHIVAVKPE
jgi:hypothetical protein